MKKMKRDRARLLTAAGTALLIGCFSIRSLASGTSLDEQYKRAQSVINSTNQEIQSAQATQQAQTTQTANGPGAAAASQNGTGVGTAASGYISDIQKTDVPAVKTIAMSEQYYEDYGMYEENIDNRFFFYASTGNGTITDQPVYVDFPANLTYTVELDGVSISYGNKTKVTARGTYVFFISGIYDNTLPLSEQTEYRTTFRFRIQDKLPSAQNLGQNTSSSSLSNFGEVVGLPSETGQIPQTLETLAADLFTQETATETAIETEPETQAEPVIATPADAAPETKSEEELQLEQQREAQFQLCGIAEIYDESLDMYVESLPSGSEFNASVQNGATVNDDVIFRLPTSNNLLLSLTRNGEVCEYAPGDAISDAGSYRAEVHDLQSREKGTFYFRIIKDAVNDLSVFNTPSGETIISCVHDGLPYEYAPESILLQEDGLYEIVYTTASGRNMNLLVNLATVPPEVTITEKRSGTSVSYSDSTAYVEAFKDGAAYTSSDVTDFTEAGSYEIHAYDKAGNETIRSFVVSRHLHTSTAVVIMLVLGIIAAAGVIYFRVRKDLNQR